MTDAPAVARARAHIAYIQNCRAVPRRELRLWLELDVKTPGAHPWAQSRHTAASRRYAIRRLGRVLVNLKRELRRAEAALDAAIADNERVAA